MSTKAPAYTLLDSQKSSLESDRTSTLSQSQSKTSSLKRIAQKVKQAAKEHHEGVNAAYASYYAPGSVRGRDGERLRWV